MYLVLVFMIRIVYVNNFQYNERLLDLDLSHNLLCEAGGISLGQTFETNDTLTRLNLSWNHIRRKGAVALCQGLHVGTPQGGSSTLPGITCRNTTGGY